MIQVIKFLGRTYVTLALLVVWSYILFSQETLPLQHLEQLVQSAERLHGVTQSDKTNSFDAHRGKCGLWLSFEIAQNWKYFSELQKAHLQILLSPQQTQKDTVIGRFHIFYDSTGNNEPALLDVYSRRIPNSSRAYVDSVGKYFNYSWDYLVNSLGYEPPPFQSGNSYYNVYIQELGYNYGETVFEPSDLINNFNPPRYTSYIRIENEFKGFYSEGIAGLKVTSAHELHHAFQIGSYGYWGSEIYIYEITSTWMEDVVYDDVNDYYCYLRDPYTPRKGQFLLPDVSFTSSDAQVTYSRAIWGKFIEKRFSRDVMRKTWEYIRQEHSLQAIDNALKDVGSEFRKAFFEWTLWNLHTGPTCDTVKYYTEGKNYPEIRKRALIDYSHVARAFIDSIDALSSSYRPLCILNSLNDSCNTNPDMMIVVSNLNKNYAYNSPIKLPFLYELKDSSDASFQQLPKGIYGRLNVSDPQNWTSIGIDSLSRDTIIIIESHLPDVFVCPNPFYAVRDRYIYFRLPKSKSTAAILSIFTSGLDKIFSRELLLNTTPCRQGTEWLGGSGLQWDGYDNSALRVPTGIYFYIIMIDDKTYTGKFALIEE